MRARKSPRLRERLPVFGYLRPRLNNARADTPSLKIGKASEVAMGSLTFIANERYV